MVISIPNTVFFSFTEYDRGIVLTIKGRAVNSTYPYLNFNVRDLLKRWNTNDVSKIREGISKKMYGTSRTIVFVGENTHKSQWVKEEVKMTLENSKPVYAIRLKDTSGKTPDCLINNGIHLYSWSEKTLQQLATK